MAILAPSILASDFVNLEREIRTVEESGAAWLHIDVMDGLFVPNITVGIPVVEAIRKITHLTLDVHLMIQQPGRYVERFLAAGADYLTIHAEADTRDAVEETLVRIHALGGKAGLSIKPRTPAEEARPWLENCDLILVMTVEPGFGGQAFQPEMLPKLRQLRQWLEVRNPACLLEVDGGINQRTAALCCTSGAQVLVAGSAFFHASDRFAFAQEIAAL